MEKTETKTEATKLKSQLKHLFMQDLLRERIVRGNLRPGQRLPNRNKLMEKFNVSCITVQRALDYLKNSGFVEACPGRGTFVTEYPPHLCQYGLLFPMANPRDQKALRIKFFRFIIDASEEFQAGRSDVHFKIYTGMDGHKDSNDYEKLVNDVKQHRLAGLIFIEVDPLLFSGTPILDEPEITRVAHLSSHLIDNVSLIHADRRKFLDMALDYLVSRNRRRIAFLLGAGDMKSIGGYIKTALAARGLPQKPFWIQKPSADPAEGGSCVHLLMAAKDENKPDGLISMHEGLTETMLAGIIASDTKVGEELEIVSHCDFPTADRTFLPMKRLGFDARLFVRKYIEIGRLQEKGNFIPETLIEPQFEDDLKEFK